MTVPLACQVTGDGPPLVILHGLFGAARNWHSIAHRLAEDYRVFAVDLRNHGHSPWTPTMTLPEMADDLEAFGAARELPPAVIIGHSVGGKVAMTFALRHPARVEALVVVDIAPAAYDHSYLPEVRAMQGLDLETVDRRSAAETALAGTIPDAETRRFLVQNLEPSGSGLAWRINLEAIGAAMTDLTGFPDPGNRDYDGRVLFVRGDRSDYIAAEHQNAIFRLFPQAEFAVVPDAGHRVHVDRPEAFLNAVTGFLDAAWV